MPKAKFIKFDASGYPPPQWLAAFLDKTFAKPKQYPMWDARRPADMENLKALALGIRQFLQQLPDGAEVGTSDLAKCLYPDMYNSDEHFRRFILGRIERVRYAELIDGLFYTMPDKRWKTPRTFYKYHNGKGLQ